MTRMHEALHKDVILSSAGVTASIVLADPIIFLSGFSKHEQAESPPALVRGSLILRITKATKIKAINLGFKGISRTDWPEGIPSDKSETHETKDVFSHEWRLFSAQFSNADKSSGAHSVSALEADAEGLQPTMTSTTAHELVNQHEAVHKGYRVFNPAEYIYNFELMLPQRLPETLKCNFGQVRWGFTLSIERHGTFKPNLTASKEITLLRTLGPSNLESSEPIVISRDWEDLLHYEIIIAGKAFAIGQKFNVAFGLVALAKVKCHRIRIYITEHTEYFCRNHRIHRVEPSHKFLLLERKSPEGNRGDLLTAAEPGMSGLTEFEFNVEIPESFPARRDRLRPNANTEYIKVYHWIKAVMRLSRQDVKQNGEPKCYEVSIDSPITLVDPRTMFASELPDYQTAKRKNSIVDALKPYREFIQTEVSTGLGGGSAVSASPTRAGENDGGLSGINNHSASGSALNGELVIDRDPTDRAIHFARQPSIAPPPFDADIRPPELLPPQYDITKENADSYERRYEEYLIGTGRLPPRLPLDLHPDNASDSNASTLSQHSDSGSGSTAHTAADEATDGKPLDEPRLDARADPLSKAPRTSPSDRDSREAEVERSRPIFSEIIWSEDGLNSDEQGGNDEVDPRAQSSSPPPDSINVLPGPAVSPENVESPFGKLTLTPVIDGNESGSNSPLSPTTIAIPKRANANILGNSTTDGATAATVATASATALANAVASSSRSSPRSIPKAGPSFRSSPFSPPLSHNQLARSSIGGSAGTDMPIFSPGSALPTRQPSAQSARHPFRTPLSVSAGSPLTSPWSESGPGAPLFPDRWTDRRDSAGSARYFRQSSVVSMDVTRQGAGDMSRRESMWDSRRPSRVGEVQELRDWPASRRNSDSSVAVSIAEYQGIGSGQQANAPLLGEEESEMDIGLEWEHDYEDFNMDSDRRSVVSAFYTVLTP